MLANPIYRAAKRTLVLARAFASPTIETVQSGLLVALYELGHGHPRRAYVTLGDAIAMAKLLAVRPGRYVDGAKEDEPVGTEDEQNSLLYWSLFVLDK